MRASRESSQVSKGPRNPAGFKGRVTQDPGTLLAAKETTVAAPAVVEPVPRLVPADVVPVDARDAPGDVRRPPGGEDKEDLSPQNGRDIPPILEEILAVLFAEAGIHLIRPLDHHVATDVAAVFLLEEGENFVGDPTDRHFGRERGTHGFGDTRRLEPPIHDLLESATQTLEIEWIATPLTQLPLDLKQLAVDHHVLFARDDCRHDKLLALREGAMAPARQRTMRPTNICQQIKYVIFYLFVNGCIISNYG